MLRYVATRDLADVTEYGPEMGRVFRIIGVKPKSSHGSSEGGERGTWVGKACRRAQEPEWGSRKTEASGSWERQRTESLPQKEHRARPCCHPAQRDSRRTADPRSWESICAVLKATKLAVVFHSNDRAHLFSHRAFTRRHVPSATTSGGLPG